MLLTHRRAALGWICRALQRIAQFTLFTAKDILHLCIQQHLRERAHSHLAKLSLNMDFFKKPKYFKHSFKFDMFIGIHIRHTDLAQSTVHYV